MPSGDGSPAVPCAINPTVSSYGALAKHDAVTNS